MSLPESSQPKSRTWLISNLDPDVEVIESPINANVWKVLVGENDTLQAQQVVVTLEAMKLEINIKVDARLDQCMVQKVLVKPGDIIESGRPLLTCTKPVQPCPQGDKDS